MFLAHTYLPVLGRFWKLPAGTNVGVDIGQYDSSWRVSYLCTLALSCYWAVFTAQHHDGKYCARWPLSGPMVVIAAPACIAHTCSAASAIECMHSHLYHLIVG